jgi:hypothetical protein
MTNVQVTKLVGYALSRREVGLAVDYSIAAVEQAELAVLDAVAGPSGGRRSAMRLATRR